MGFNFIELPRDMADMGIYGDSTYIHRFQQFFSENTNWGCPLR
jgi:hypothetical protein